MSKSEVHNSTVLSRSSAVLAAVAVLAGVVIVATAGTQLSGAISDQDVGIGNSQLLPQDANEAGASFWHADPGPPEPMTQQPITMELLPVNGSASLLNDNAPARDDLKKTGQFSVWPRTSECTSPTISDRVELLNVLPTSVTLASFGAGDGTPQSVGVAARQVAPDAAVESRAPVDVTLPRNNEAGVIEPHDVVRPAVVRTIPTDVSFENVFADDSVDAFPLTGVSGAPYSQARRPKVTLAVGHTLSPIPSRVLPGDEATGPASGAHLPAIQQAWPPTEQAFASQPPRARDELRISFDDEADESAGQQSEQRIPDSSVQFESPGSNAPQNSSVQPNDAGVTIPFSGVDPVNTDQQLRIAVHDGLVTIIAHGADLGTVLTTLATDHGVNIVSADAAKAPVSVTLKDVPLDDALNAILTVHGMTWTRRNGIIIVSRVDSEQAMSAMAQGRIVRVFELSFARATDVQPVVEALLSPVGQVQVTMPGEILGGASASNISSGAGGAIGGGTQNMQARRTRDRLIVEDLPDYIERVEGCIAQIDVPPRQVLIEAYILEVDLTQSLKHGINLESLSDFGSGGISFQSGNSGFASTNSVPSLLVGIDRGDMDGLLDALKRTLSARTLAAPRVLVTHGHRAEIQVGGQIGFLQSTTTETSTIQGVEFLDVGVILTVTPYISSDGRIQLQVHPEVSSGQLNEKTQLPESERAHVETSILLRDGQGMVIGGLIRESDRDARAKTPLLGETWMINRLFQHMDGERTRSEVIIALIPRIVECECGPCGRDQLALERATTPLLDPALRQMYRPWEPLHPEVLYRPGDWQKNYRVFRDSDGTRINDRQYAVPQVGGASYSSESWSVQPSGATVQPADDFDLPNLSDAGSAPQVDPSRFTAPSQAAVTRTASANSAATVHSASRARPVAERPRNNGSNPKAGSLPPRRSNNVPRSSVRRSSDAGNIFQRLRDTLRR